METLKLIRIALLLGCLDYLGYASGQCPRAPSGGFYGWEGQYTKPEVAWRLSRGRGSRPQDPKGILFLGRAVETAASWNHVHVSHA